ncbi:aminotransferase class-V domain-containing protein [Ditylenchus destructor]|nr:aminotransferase class-V domain-containing protein [Ditylenchus destructor]
MVSNEMSFNKYLERILDTTRTNKGVSLYNREVAKLLDDADELKHLRQEFHIPKATILPDVDKDVIDENDDCIYMCGHSLGLMPKCTQNLMTQQFNKWANMGVFGHLNGPLPWAYCDEACSEGICRLVGAQPEEVAMMNSLTMNIHVLFTAFYKPNKQRNKVLLESRAFPSDHYAIESQIRLNGFDPATSMICLEPRKGEETLRTDDILHFIENEGDSIAVIFFSGVQYYTGQLFDIQKITDAGQKKGCTVGWDLAHAFANVPLHLHEWNVDFACWCTYKYGCTGAGGLGGAFIHSRYANDFDRERMLGWWCHKMSSRFFMNNELELDVGAAGFRVSNPSFMLSVAMLGSLQVFSKTSMEQLRNKSLRLTGYLEFLIEKHFGSKNDDSKVWCEIITPRNPAERGCQLSLKFNCDIKNIYGELVKRGIAVDKRYPHVIRVAPVHLYNSFDDVWRFVDKLLECIHVVNERELHTA